jgi:hypothetical protein
MKLSEKQKKQLKQIADANQKQMADARQGVDFNDRQARNAFMASMRQIGQEMQQQTEEAIAGILKPSQQKRFGEILLQIEGPLAVTRPEIAEQVGLTEMQAEQINEIVTAMREKEREARRAGFPPGGPGGNGGPRGNGGPNGNGGGPAGNAAPGANGQGGNRPGGNAPAPGNAVAKADSQPQDPTAPRTKGAGGPNGRGNGNRGNFDPAAMMERMKKTNDEQDKIRDEAITLISKLLKKPQKTAFNRLLGKPVADLSKLLPDRGPNDRGGPGGMFGFGGRGPGGPGGGPGQGPGGQPGNGPGGGGRPNNPGGQSQPEQ